MSGIARIMLARGVTVSGSDSADSPLLAELAAAGARVHGRARRGASRRCRHAGGLQRDQGGQSGTAEAQRRGIRVLHRAAALASVMLGHQAIAVAGTHGKTTTTSMITTVLRHSGADPSYVIGGILAETGAGAAQGGGPAFVVEADESDGSFLMFAPDAAVVTSVEADHLDNYGTLAAIEAAFAAFAGKISDGGLLLACADDPRRHGADGHRPAGGDRADLRHRGRCVLPGQRHHRARHEHAADGHGRRRDGAGRSGARSAGDCRSRPAQRAERRGSLRPDRSARSCGRGRRRRAWPPTAVPAAGWS